MPQKKGQRDKQRFDLQNMTQKTKDRATRTQLNPEVNLGVPERYAAPGPHVVPFVCQYNMQVNVI